MFSGGHDCHLQASVFRIGRREEGSLVGQGWAGHGRVGQDRAGQGWAGLGWARKDEAVMTINIGYPSVLS